MDQLLVSKMLSPQLITVTPDTDIQQVLNLMQEQRISCIVQIDADKIPTGIFTEHVLVTHLANSQGPLTGPVKNFTLPPLITQGDTLCNEAFRLMSENRQRQLIIVDNQQKLLGLVNESDFIHHMDYIPMVMHIRVRDVMSRNVHQLAPDNTLLDALKLMDTAVISCVVITEHGQPSGILTERDIVRLANTLDNASTTLLKDVMHHPVQTLTDEVYIKDASHLMEMKGIRRFVVTDAQQQITGIITLRDITKALKQGYVGYLEDELARKEQKIEQIEAQLKQINEQTLLSNLMNQVSDGIFIIRERDMQIVEVNQQACINLGYTTEELVGRSIKEISSTAAEMDVEHFKQTLIEKKYTMHRTNHKHRNGRLIPVEASITQLTLGDEHYHLSVARDISERLESEAALRESEETYRSVLDTALDGFWIIDNQGKIADVNPAYCQMSGYDREELLQMDVPDLNVKETLQDTLKRIDKIKQLGSAQFTSKHRRKDGSLFDIEVKVTYWPKHGGRFFAYLRDITEQNRDQLRLKQAAAVFENTREAVMMVSANRRIQMVNKAFTQMTGYSETQIIGQSPAILQSNQHSKNFYKAMWRTIRTVGHWQGELISRRADGSTYPELLNISVVRNNQGQISHYVGVFADLTQQRESESKLAYLDYHDPLTGLANRKNLIVRAEHAIHQAEKEQGQVALMLLDLDRFKNVNDSYGHKAGDELLKQIARALDNGIPHVDTLCRLGGDEFVLLFNSFHDIDELSLIANKVIKLINRPWDLSQGKRVTIGASLGISLSPQNGNDAHELLQHADAALYQAKAEGRSRFSFFSEQLTENARHRLELETRMHHALQSEELRVYFQPQIDIKENKLIGAEALVRWQDPEFGLQSPANFIELCEQNGQINEIGRQVLLQTCRQGRQWLDAGYPSMVLAVNLSANQIGSHILFDQIYDILHETGFPANCLELELTESALMTETEETIALLEKFRAMGIHIAIDDFGTGYSSFTYLKRFPIDVLKIDKSFIDEIEYKSEDREIVSAMIAMGHALGIRVLAEGVETQNQLNILTEMKCDIYQGYLCSKPAPAEIFESQLQQTEH